MKVPEWWTYRLEDFLLFSPRVYWRLVELHNSGLWPLPLIMLAFGMGFFLYFGQGRVHGKQIALVLAMLWAFVGWSFLWNRYAEINWAITYVAPVFLLEAVLLAGVAAHRGLAPCDAGIVRRIGLVITGAGLLLYPLLAPLMMRPLAAAEVFGIAPDPTAVATVGVAVAGQGRLPLLLLPIPLGWLLFSGLTLYAMNDAQAFVVLGAAALGSALAVYRCFSEPWC